MLHSRHVSATVGMGGKTPVIMPLEHSHIMVLSDSELLLLLLLSHVGVLHFDSRELSHLSNRSNLIR